MRDFAEKLLCSGWRVFWKLLEISLISRSAFCCVDNGAKCLDLSVRCNVVKASACNSDVFFKCVNSRPNGRKITRYLSASPLAVTHGVLLPQPSSSKAKEERRPEEVDNWTVRRVNNQEEREEERDGAEGTT